MKPVTQLISNDGRDGKLPGDCVRACYASILERPIETVPHFVAGEVKNDDGTAVDWHSGVNIWLKREGYLFQIQHRGFFKHTDIIKAYRKERDAAGIEDRDGRDSLWMYDATEHAPYHPGHWIASVISENFIGATHAIVMYGAGVAHDPSPHPRRTPYLYVGETTFVIHDPVACRK